MAESARTLLRRFDELRSRDAQVRTQLQEIAEFVRPNRANIIRDVVEGQKLTQRLFDSTAGYSSSLLAASLHGTLTPSTQPWLSYEMRNEVLGAVKSVRDWLEDCARRTYKALRQTNFNTAVHELDLDLTDFGQGAILIEEKPPLERGAFGGLRFRCIPIGTYSISEDFEGRADTLFRLFKLPARVAQTQWGDAVGEGIAQKANGPRADEQVEIMHAVYPRDDYDGTKRNARNMPWASCYVGVEQKIKIEEGGFQEFPYAVPRWSKTSGETNGRGPSHIGLPDIKSLNEAKRITLQGAPLAMQPPSVELNDAVIGEFDRSAGGRIVVEPQGNRPISEIVGFLDTKTRPDMAQFTLTDLRQSIKEIYFVPQLQLQEGPQMTATEIQVRYELMQRILGPTTGRLEAEFLNPLAERIFRIMARARAYASMPAELARAVKTDTADIDIRYEGPMARAQRTIEIQAQDRVVAFAMNWAAAEGKPDALDVLVRDKMIRARGEITGLPSDQIAGEEQVKAIRDERAQAVKAQQAAQAAAMAAKAGGDVAPLIKEVGNLQTTGQAKNIVNGARAA